MRFNPHFEIKDKHAFLSPSNYHWINYDDAHLEERFTLKQAAAKGTELHKLASDLIRLGVKLPQRRTTLNLYVNDCIGYHMAPEVPLFHSWNCFGTADAIGYSNRTKTLRIADLKTGITPVKVTQLEVYAALFCLEYRFKPFDINIELRIYQNNDVVIYDADKNAIMHIIDRIVTFDKRINELREEALD